ncbi:hypothetical protein GOQ29_07045 [Clostridium sp. D2Q-14]|uniref:hypothetical protein n=1 Tax=Anaeromonas gelatinilytica TaxID=2683194 RepID=UPI00193B920B|nr:hypothetical protein [Anaeromonas gelatinilytica]MBS4535373.1 hypothetical protein [Anaeromonas gelatinilytica]
MNKHKYILTVILISILFLKSSITFGNTNDSQSKLYMIVINNLSLEDINEMDFLKKMISDGSIGLMNPKGVSSYTNYEGFVTINSTDKVFGGKIVHYPLDILKKGNVIGQDINNYSSNFTIDNIIYNNENNLYNPNIGVIGDLLNSNNIESAVFDYSDTADTFIGMTGLIAMNKDGKINNILNFYNPYNDGDYSENIEKYYELIINKIDSIENTSDFVIIDTENLNNPIHTRLAILNRIDDFLNSIIKRVDRSRDRVIIISPNVKEGFDKGLTPAIIWGKDINKGLLYSDSTKREGIISNLDIAAEIVKNFNIYEDDFKNNGIENIDYKSNLNYINELNNKINKTSNLRIPILKIVIIIGFLLLILYLIFSLLVIENKYIISLLSYIVYILCLLPLVLIIGPIFNNNIYFILILLFSLLILFKFLNVKIQYIFSLIFIILIIDILNKNKLILFSVLGYDPIIGARYYGLGNEMAGILIFSMVMFSDMITEKNNKSLIMGIYFFTFLIVIFPQWGSNLGSGIAIFIMFLYLVYRDFKEKEYDKVIIKILLISLIIIFLVVIYILFLSTGESHITNFLSIIFSNGLKGSLSIFKRKVLVNIRLIGNSLWSKMFLITIPIMFYLINKFIKYKSLNKIDLTLFNSLIIGSIVGFLANDSGLLLSALINLYICNYIIYVTIVEGINKGSE